MATIFSSNFESPAADGSAQAAGLTYTSADWVLDSAKSRNGSQSLRLNHTNSGAAQSFFLDTPSGSGQGDATKFSTWFFISSTSDLVYCLSRCSTSSGGNFYYAKFGGSGSGSSGIGLFKSIGGTDTALSATVGTGEIPIGAWGKVGLVAYGPTISVEMQRGSDNKYLTADGTWQVAQCFCISVEDTSIAGVDGQFAGVLIYPGTGALYFDDVLFETYGGVPASGVTINADNPAIKSFGFREAGSGGSSYRHSINSGNYLLVNFTGIAVSINFDLATLGGQTPAVSYRIDAEAWQRVTLAAGSIDIFNLTTGAHRLEFQLDQSFPFSGSSGVRFTGLTLNTGESVSAPILQPSRGLIYGDSIMNNQNESFFSNLAIPAVMRPLMRAEIEVAAFSGQGYLGNATGYGPGTTFLDTWDKYDSTHSRLAGGSYISHYDWICIEHGINDAAVTADVIQGQIESIRAAFAGPICVNLGAYNGANKTVITNGVSDYLAAHPGDTLVHGVDLGVLSYPKADAVHPNVAGAAILANAQAVGLDEFVFIEVEIGYPTRNTVLLGTVYGPTDNYTGELVSTGGDILGAGMI